MSKKKKVCINRESNAGRIDGNDPGYHYPTDAFVVVGRPNWNLKNSNKTKVASRDVRWRLHQMEDLNCVYKIFVSMAIEWKIGIYLLDKTGSEFAKWDTDSNPRVGK